jgi:hypothetical protein
VFQEVSKEEAGERDPGHFNVPAKCIAWRPVPFAFARCAGTRGLIAPWPT